MYAPECMRDNEGNTYRGSLTHSSADELLSASVQICERITMPISHCPLRVLPPPQGLLEVTSAGALAAATTTTKDRLDGVQSCSVTDLGRVSLDVGVVDLVCVLHQLVLVHVVAGHVALLRLQEGGGFLGRVWRRKVRN